MDERRSGIDLEAINGFIAEEPLPFERGALTGALEMDGISGLGPRLRIEGEVPWWSEDDDEEEALGFGRERSFEDVGCWVDEDAPGGFDGEKLLVVFADKDAGGRAGTVVNDGEEPITPVGRC